MPARTLIAFLLIAFAVAMAPSLAARAAATPSLAVPRVVTLDTRPATSEQVWRLRSALNVAALMCADRAIAGDYNRLLRSHAPALDRAWQQEQQRYRLLHGANWQTVQDRALTRLYNRVANTGERAHLCAEAADILADARMVPPAQFAHFANAASARLEQLFDGPALASR
jgi:hypothetical protein